MKKKYFARQKATARAIALQRIHALFAEAEKAFASHPERSHRYAQLISKLSTRYKVKIPREYKRRICKECKSFLMPGKNCVVRTRKGRVVYHCLECGRITRYPYIREKKAKRSKKKRS